MRMNFREINITYNALCYGMACADVKRVDNKILFYRCGKIIAYYLLNKERAFIHSSVVLIGHMPKQPIMQRTRIIPGDYDEMCKVEEAILSREESYYYD